MLLCPRFIVLIIEHADCHKTQANNNNYEELALAHAISVNTDEAVITVIPSPPLAPITIDDSSEPNMENPYHVTADEISTIRNVWYIICTA